jgi:hypothetical protein
MHLSTTCPRVDSLCAASHARRRALPVLANFFVHNCSALPCTTCHFQHWTQCQDQPCKLKFPFRFTPMYMVSVLWRSGTPHTSSKLRQGAGCVSTRCHVNCSFQPYLPAEVGFDAAVPWPWTSPPCWGELRRCHMSLSSESHLPAEVGSGTATCLAAPDLASLLRWALRRHVSHSSGLCLPERGAPVLARVPRPPVGCGPRNKKGLVALVTQLGSRVSKARSCVSEVPVDVQTATVRLYSTASAHLTIPVHSCKGDTTWQDGTTVRVMFSTVER